MRMNKRLSVSKQNQVQVPELGLLSSLARVSASFHVQALPSAGTTFSLTPSLGDPNRLLPSLGCENRGNLPPTPRGASQAPGSAPGASLGCKEF